MVEHNPFELVNERPLRRRLQPMWLVALPFLVTLLTHLLFAHGRLLGSAIAAGCPSETAPRVAGASAADLGELREEVAAVMPWHRGSLYEEGTIESSNAWSDDSPSKPSLTSNGTHPAAYEMRWWAPDRDDVVADVFVFASQPEARRFFDDALSSRCRRGASTFPALRPGAATNLVWVNPEDVIQEDIYILRRKRVYRIAQVRPDAKRTTLSPAARQSALRLLDARACLLPDAGCTSIPTIYASALEPARARPL